MLKKSPHTFAERHGSYLSLPFQPNVQQSHNGNMSARDLLLYDYRHRLFPATKEGEKVDWDGWGINFESPANSTATPTPRDHYSSLFLTVNHTNDPIHDFKQFIKALNRDRRTNMQVVVTEGHSANKKTRCKISLREGDTGLVLLEGDIHKSGDSVFADTNVGFYAQFMATNEKEWQLVRTLGACVTHGYGSACLVSCFLLLFHSSLPS